MFKKTDLEIVTLNEDHTVCFCCGANVPMVNSESYPEYYCNRCDYSFYSSQEPIRATDYEESEKYNNYYSGRSPLLWHHKVAISIINSACRGSDERVLDFGCYDGFFVKAMLDEGLNAYGVDWNRRSIKLGGEVYNIKDRLNDSIEGVYDVITALEVIEHFRDPTEFMELINQHLQSKGLIVLSCPNKHSLYRPATDWPPHHFSRFSMRALSVLLDKYGFDVVDYRAEMSLFQLVRNYVGDKIRTQQGPLVHSKATSNRSSVVEFLRKSANNISVALVPILRPIDWILFQCGIRYISQVIVARKR